MLRIWKLVVFTITGRVSYSQESSMTGSQIKHHAVTVS